MPDPQTPTATGGPDVNKPLISKQEQFQVDELGHLTLSPPLV